MCAQHTSQTHVTRRNASSSSSSSLRVSLPPRPSRLVDWDAYTYTTLYAYDDAHDNNNNNDRHAVASIDAQERVQRAGIVQLYVSDLLAVLRAYNAQWRALTQRCLTLLQHDEVEERRFIAADADLLPYKLFSRHTWAAMAQCVARREARARVARWREQLRAACVLVTQHEAVARMQLSTEALDSVFLKLCQTLPGWTWRRVRDDDDDDTRRRRACARTALACRGVADEEARERARYVREYVQWYAGVAVLLARVQKTYWLRAYAVPADVTAQRLLHGSATTLQAAYRGYALRKRRAQATA